jgi:hypothetical protein
MFFYLGSRLGMVEQGFHLVYLTLKEINLLLLKSLQVGHGGGQSTDSMPTGHGRQSCDSNVGLMLSLGFSSAIVTASTQTKAWLCLGSGTWGRGQGGTRRLVLDSPSWWLGLERGSRSQDLDPVLPCPGQVAASDLRGQKPSRHV